MALSKKDAHKKAKARAKLLASRDSAAPESLPLMDDLLADSLPSFDDRLSDEPRISESMFAASTGSVIIHGPEGDEAMVNDAESSTGSIIIRRSITKSLTSGSLGGSVIVYNDEDSEEEAHDKSPKPSTSKRRPKVSSSRDKSENSPSPYPPVSSSSTRSLSKSVSARSSLRPSESPESSVRLSSRSSSTVEEKRKKVRHRRGKSRALVSPALNEVLLPAIKREMPSAGEEERELLTRLMQTFSALDERNPKLLTQLVRGFRATAPIVSKRDSTDSDSVSEISEILLERWRNRVQPLRTKQ